MLFIALGATHKVVALEMANYYIIASTQKITNTVCGTGELVMKEERRLPKKNIDAQTMKF